MTAIKPKKKIYNVPKSDKKPKRQVVKKVKIENGGRAFKLIDWDKVDRYLMAGCSGVEIAALLGMHWDTLYNRCRSEKGIMYTEYSQEKKRKGETLLRAKQYELAMKGDKTMLVWIGKNRMGQSDKLEQKNHVTNETVTIYIPDNGRGDCELKKG